MENPDQPPGGERIQLDPHDADEPTVTLPRPPGWDFMPSRDSPPVRGILYNREPRKHGFTPNAVVTVEELTGQVGFPSQALAKQRAAVINIVGELDTETPAMMSGFAFPPSGQSSILWESACPTDDAVSLQE